MSAMLATTLRRRTSDATVAWMAGYGDFGAVHRVVRNRGSIVPDAHPRPSPATARSTSAGRSRRCRAARGDPTIRLARGPRVAGDPDPGRPGDRGARPRTATRSGRRRGDRAPTAPSTASRRCSASTRTRRRSRPAIRSSRSSPAASRASGSRGRGAVLESLVPGDPRAEGDRRGGASRLARAHPRVRRAAPGPPEWRLRLAAGAGDPGRAPLLRLPPVRGRAAAGRPHPAGRGAGGLVRGDRRPAARRGLRAADGRARDRAVDRGRGRRPGARRRGRGERRRLPPARTSSPTRWPASRAAPTRGCSSCSSRTAGQRARVVRLLELSGIRAPRYGPRLSLQRIEDL